METDPRLRSTFEQVVLYSPVAKELDLEVMLCTADSVILRLPFRERNTTFEDVIHGGVIATLIDIAGAAGVVLGANAASTGGVTASLAIHYLAAARGVDLLAEAKPLRRGKLQSVLEVFVRDPNGRLIAKGTLVGRSFFLA